MKKNKFDAFVLFFLIAAVFALGIHAGKDRDDEGTVEFYAAVRVEKAKGSPTEGEICHIDGRYPITALATEGSITVFACEGFSSEAGFLLGGAKYLSENQPVKIIFEDGFSEGRIVSLSDGIIPKYSAQRKE